MKEMLTEEQERALKEQACASRARAYAPYSNYRVGAAVLGESGAIYTGTNVENAAYSPTICAERLAIFKAVEAGERELQAVVVCTENGGSPCGPCRQVMREFAGDEMPVYIVDAQGHSRVKTLGALLPDSFGPEHL
jgi:cytidine deaminase